MVSQSHEVVTAAQPDFALINNSDCKACHSMSQKSVGPSYLAIADRYKADPATIRKLASKIIQGGSGSWSDTHAMSAHPQLSEGDAEQMVKYILSLKDEAAMTNRIAATGSIAPERLTAKGDYIITVSYTDKAVNGATANVAQKMLPLRPPVIDAAAFDEQQNVTKSANGEVSFEQNESWIMLRSIDLSGLKSVSFQIPPGHPGGKLTLRLGVAVGADAGIVSLNENQSGKVTMKLQPREGIHDIYFVYTGSGKLKVKNIQFNR